MPCVEGRYWVTFNGEIFNFVELRRELEARGHRFISETDTEVIGNAYRQWGPDCVLRFNGMWAFALWDTERRELFLSRDRFGIKPLHYMAEPNRFVFASELKSFLHLRGFTARENEDVVKRALLSPYTIEAVEDTLLQGVQRLRGGHNMMVNAAGIKIWRWWRTLDHVSSAPRTLKEQAERFRELFFDACRLRLRSDVPLATCLSGGIDSSAVLCTLAALREQQMNGTANTERLMYDSQRAFVATFPGTAWDERKYAELAVQHAGAEPRYRPITPEMAIENLRQYAYDFEGIGGSLVIPLWCIYRELRRDGVVVSLDGHGGDELLAGYLFHLTKALRGQGSLLRAPLRTLDLVRTQHGMFSDGPQDSPGLVSLLAHSGIVSNDPFLRTANRWMNGIRRRARSGVPKSGTAAAFRPPETQWMRPWEDHHHYLDEEEEERAAIEALGVLNGQLYREFHYYVLPNILRNFDRCSMAHGVEVRMPFMDWRLVCFLFGLPEESKVGGGFTKRVLREAMRDTMPERLRTRKGKIGFNSPMPNWFNGVLDDWIWEQSSSPSFIDNPLWNGPAIRDFIAARHRTKTWTLRDCERVWPFLQAHLWRQVFLERSPTAPLSPT
jgi:asparagine synthase (glutamine-hydrolysing)